MYKSYTHTIEKRILRLALERHNAKLNVAQSTLVYSSQDGQVIEWSSVIAVFLTSVPQTLNSKAPNMRSFIIYIML